jgi:hypothetical protein
VPEPGELDAEERALLDRVGTGFQTVGELYNACKFQAALGETLTYDHSGAIGTWTKGELPPH